MPGYLKGIAIEKLNHNEEGYKMLKQNLIERFLHTSETKKPNKLDDLINRTQKHNESTTKYGQIWT